MRALLFYGAAGGLLAGAWVARLTLGLNPQVAASPRDAAVLFAGLLVLYGLAGGLAGAAAALAAWAGRRYLGLEAGRVLAAFLVAAPVAYVALLPDSGWAGETVSRALPGPGWPWRLAAVALGATFLVAAGRAAVAALGAGARRLSPEPERAAALLRRLAVAAGLVAFVLVALTALSDRGEPEVDAAAVLAGLEPPPAAAEPPPLVVLVVDGADLGVIEPMVANGELPAFAKLMRRGTWGPLATLEPTLSPLVWTTLATGREALAHGVFDFVAYRVPGVRPPIARFPRHSGLGHRLFPTLAKLSGFGRPPVTGALRRSPALWEIAGERYDVGVYRWLLTWPAEPVRGFVVSGGVVAGPGRWARRWWAQLRRSSPDAPLTHPPDLELATPERRRPRRRELRRYLAPGQRLERRDRRLRTVVDGLTDPTLAELTALRRAYRPRLTLAAFYSVDAFQHRFARDRQEGGAYAPAVAERYRFTDRQLGRFLATLAPGAHLLVVSDHGYDFEADHHFNAPPGIFFALGPAFLPGRRLEGLGVYDVAPLALHLLGLPVAADMPAVAGKTYARALDPDWLAAHPISTLPTYGERRARPALVPGAADEAVEERLKSLGYL